MTNIINLKENERVSNFLCSIFGDIIKKVLPFDDLWIIKFSHKEQSFSIYSYSKENLIRFNSKEIVLLCDNVITKYSVAPKIRNNWDSLYKLFMVIIC